VFSKEDVKVEAPVPSPGKMICVGHNYREHILEMGREIPPYPVVFAKFANTVIGPEDDIPHYPISDQLDYEAEFAFVIGKRARNVSQAEALDYVAGYTIVNDVTYRDLQRRTLQWLQGKTVDGSAPMGPWLVTTDELSDPSGLEVVLTVNGEERQRSNTKNLVFSVQYLVEFLSGLMTLEPGDVILTGTPGGVGVARDPQVFLKDGDVVRIEIDGIGALENKVKKVTGEISE
jgi:acylpyruvate hydrolase